MRYDYGYGYGPANLLGTVTQSAGLPSGAVIKRGRGAVGDYVRFAGGTQICTHLLILSLTVGNDVAAIWSFPARLWRRDGDPVPARHRAPGHGG